MKIKILPSANEDLINGFYFYERQSAGLGSYFLDTLFSDIDFLILYYGVHPIHSNVFLSQFITKSTMMTFWSMRCSIAEKTRHG